MSIVKAEDARYADLVDKVIKITNDATKSILTFYWDLGGSVNELEGPNGHKYGNRTVYVFVEDLYKQGVTISLSSMYKAAKFNKGCSDATLKRLIDGKWSWRNALLLFTDNVTPEKAMEIIKRVEAGEISQNKTKDLIADADRGPTNITVRGLSLQANRIKEYGHGYQSKLTVLDNIVDRLKELPISERRNHRQAIEELNNELSELVLQIRKKIKVINSLKF